jgi:DNA-binding beta-propeller fold protein YncE
MKTHFQATTALACLLLACAGAARSDEARKPRPIGTQQGGVASVHFSPDGKFIASGGGDKMIRIWDVAAAKEVRSFAGPSSFACAVRYSPDGKTLAAGGYETASGNPIYLFDPQTGKEVGRFDGHPSGGVRRVEFTPDGKKLVSAGFDGHLRVWDVETKKELHAIKADGGTVYGLAVSHDGKFVASAGRDGLKLWEVETGKEIVREPMSKFNCITVAFAPDGKTIAAGDASSVTLWEAATGKQVGELTGYKGELSQLLFSADGRTLYTASYDRFVRLWEVRTGRMIQEVEGHTGWVWGIALSPDEKTIVSCSVDTKLVCWDLAGLGRPAGKKAKLSATQMQKHLGDLASNDAGAAYRAVCALAGDPDSALPHLEKRLTDKRGGTSAKDLARLVADLDDEDWDTRETASAGLEKAGAVALPLLKKALVKPPSLEVKRRAERLVRKLDPTSLPPEELVALRGVQALEYIGTQQARKLLEQLARASSPRLAEEASEAVKRLERTNR